MSGFDDVVVNPMSALAQRRVSDKRDWLKTPVAQKLYENDIWEILMDHRIFSGDRSGLKVHPSDVDDWTPTKRQEFLQNTMTFIDGLNFSNQYDKKDQNDFNKAMAMAGKATVVLNTCRAEDMACDTNGHRYPMTAGIDVASLTLFNQILKWRDNFMKTINTHFDHLDAYYKSDTFTPHMPPTPPPEYTYWNEYNNALQDAGIPEHMRRGGKSTRRKRNKKTKRAKTKRTKTRRNRKRR